MSNKHFDPSSTGIRRARDDLHGNGNHPPTKKEGPSQHHQPQPSSGLEKSDEQHREQQQETKKNEEQRQPHPHRYRSNGQHQQRSEKHQSLWFPDNTPDYSLPALLPDEEKEASTTNTPDPQQRLDQQRHQHIDRRYTVTSTSNTPGDDAAFHLCDCKTCRHHGRVSVRHELCNGLLNSNNNCRELRPVRGATAVPKPYSSAATATPRMDDTLDNSFAAPTAATRMDDTPPGMDNMNEEEDPEVYSGYETGNAEIVDDDNLFECPSDQSSDDDPLRALLDRLNSDNDDDG